MRQYRGKYMMLVCVLLASGAFMGDRSFAETSDFLSPISVVAGVDGKELYIAEDTSNQVAVFDIASGYKGTVEKQTAMIDLDRIKPEFGSRTRPNKFDRATLNREFGLFQQAHKTYLLVKHNIRPFFIER